jgi:hypothetical protein
MRVAMVAPFMAKGDTRHFLNGINVRPHPDGGAVITATNGHIMGAVHDRLAICEHEVTLQLHSSIVSACRAHQKDSRELVFLKGRLAVVKATEELCIQPGDPVIEVAGFPRYERIIPDASRLVPGLLGHFQAHYMALLQQVTKVLKTFRPGYCPIVFFHVEGDQQSIGIARTPMLDEFVAVLMPQREESPIDSVPGWVGTAKRADVAAEPAKAAA